MSGYFYVYCVFLHVFADTAEIPICERGINIFVKSHLAEMTETESAQNQTLTFYSQYLKTA